MSFVKEIESANNAKVAEYEQEEQERRNKDIARTIEVFPTRIAANSVFAGRELSDVQYFPGHALFRVDDSPVFICHDTGAIRNTVHCPECGKYEHDQYQSGIREITNCRTAQKVECCYECKEEGRGATPLQKSTPAELREKRAEAIGGMSAFAAASETGHQPGLTFREYAAVHIAAVLAKDFNEDGMAHAANAAVLLAEALAWRLADG